MKAAFQKPWILVVNGSPVALLERATQPSPADFSKLPNPHIGAVREATADDIKELIHKTDAFENAAFVDRNRVVRWSVNQNVPSDDYLLVWEANGKGHLFSAALSRAARAEDTARQSTPVFTTRDHRSVSSFGEVA